MSQMKDMLSSVSEEDIASIAPSWTDKILPAASSAAAIIAAAACVGGVMTSLPISGGFMLGSFAVSTSLGALHLGSLFKDLF
jgi:hypothetical protein